MKIYDENDKERSIAWLHQTFGPVTIHTPANNNHTFEIVELHARKGQAALLATVQDTDGTPLPAIPTVWHWPDAPPLPGAGWLGHGVVGLTDHNGRAAHAMGPGAHYAPPTKGPHALWIQGTDALNSLGAGAPNNRGTGRSQMIDGLGMITTDGRRHLDVVFQIRSHRPGSGTPQTPDQPHPPPPPPTPPELATILNLMLEARELIQTLIDRYNEQQPSEDASLSRGR